MGAFIREEIKVRRNNIKTFIKVSENYPIKEMIDNLVFYLPYCAHIDFDYFENSIRQLTLSILDAPKL